MDGMGFTPPGADWPTVSVPGRIYRWDGSEQPPGTRVIRRRWDSGASLVVPTSRSATVILNAGEAVFLTDHGGLVLSGEAYEALVPTG